MEMICILLKYNTMKCQLQSMSGTLLGTCCKMSALVQCKIIFSYLSYHKMSATINKCQIPKYITYSRLYMKPSGIEMTCISITYSRYD